jgi:hypothetical protein
MIRLAFPFTRDRFVHRLLARSGDVCLIERENLETGSTHWEVIRVQTRPAETAPDGRTYPAREAYPNTERWGERGWTFTALPEAAQKYRALASMSESEASAGADESPRLAPARGALRAHRAP